MGDHIIAMQNLHYTYADGTKALKGINLGIRRGKCTAILGGNGAGKSTLFLNFNGIHKPTAGQVLFENQPITYSPLGLKELRKKVGIVFQDPDNQLFFASVMQDISFGPLNLKLPLAEVQRRVLKVMERTGVADFKHKPTHALSFGQKKRVAIAGVLAMEPEVLILDEPTAGLDPLGASEIMKLMQETQKELGITIILATHDIDLVPLYCDYAYVLQQGEIVLGGTPKEVFFCKEILRQANLRLPRIGHLLEILQDKDDFALDASACTISEARRVLKAWKSSLA